MPLFDYAGIDKHGNPVSGEADAPSAYELIETLRGSGILVHAAEARDRMPAPRGAKAALSLDELNQFTDHLAALTRSGMPLAPALAELARDARSQRLRRVLEETHHAVEGGHALEDALARHGTALPPLYLSLIRVGERTGNLPGVLLQLASYGQRHAWLRQRLLLAIAYPLFLLLAMLLFLGVFVTAVIGQFEQMYLQFGAALPGITAAVLAVGRLTASFGYPAIGLLGALATATWMLFGRAPLGSAARRVWENLLLRCPGAGSGYQAILSARFFRALALLLENGAPIVEALHLSGTATGSSRFAAAAARAGSRVAQGTPVGEALGDTGVLRPTESWMMKQGETLGNFPGTLARLADLCDREAVRTQQNMISMLGPALVAVCGLLVGLVVVACFLPIFQFSTLIQG
jgi:type II secretory pathway component PulF